MKQLKNKFIVINTKRFEEMNEYWQRVHNLSNDEYHPCTMIFLEALAEFISDYKRITEKEMNQKYIVCNQDEPYAQDVLEIIINGEKEKKF
jgi:hypothetical protein